MLPGSKGIWDGLVIKMDTPDTDTYRWGLARGLSPHRPRQDRTNSSLRAVAKPAGQPIRHCRCRKASRSTNSSLQVSQSQRVNQFVTAGVAKPPGQPIPPSRFARSWAIPSGPGSRIRSKPAITSKNTRLERLIRADAFQIPYCQPSFFSPSV